MRIVRRLAAACAVLALVLACVASDSQGAFSGDDSDDVVASRDLSAVLPARAEPPPALSPCGPVFFVERTPTGHAPELEIFRPPQARG